MLPDPPWADKSDRIETVAITIVIKVIVMGIVLALDGLIYVGTRNTGLPMWIQYGYFVFPVLMFIFLFDKTIPNIIIKLFGIYPLVSLMILVFASILLGDTANLLGFAMILIWTLFYWIPKGSTR